MTVRRGLCPLTTRADMTEMDAIPKNNYWLVMPSSVPVLWLVSITLIKQDRPDVVPGRFGHDGMYE